jgi:N6-adenosine-specific RNA methylase IME4
MDDKRYESLRADIETHGLREPITLCDGMILDGRNRYRACCELQGVELKTREFEGDPWASVWSLNGERRDLVDDQRYLIWKHCAEQSEIWQTEKRRIAEEGNRKRSQAAKQQPRTGTGFGPKPGGSTKCATTTGKRELGQIARAAASKTNRGAVVRGDALAAAHPDLADDVRLGRKKPAEARREAKRRETAGKVASLPNGKHTVIYADPPWDYSDKQAVKGAYGTGTGAADGHYPCMKLSELMALDVASLAADDSVLFLWVTSPLLPQGLGVAKAWGFSYKASFVWDKVKHNMGHYNSVRHEFLLVCTRGSCTPQVSKLFDSVQSIERAKHSEKPEEFRRIIETLYPKGRKVELFARKKVKGWKAHGNEV